MNVSRAFHVRLIIRVDTGLESLLAPHHKVQFIFRVALADVPGPVAQVLDAEVLHCWPVGLIV